MTSQKSRLSHAMRTIDRGSQHEYLVRNTWKHQIREGRTHTGKLTYPASTINKLPVCQSLETFHESYLPFHSLFNPGRARNNQVRGKGKEKNETEMIGRIHLPSCRLDDLKEILLQGKESLNFEVLCVDYYTAGQTNYWNESVLVT